MGKLISFTLISLNGYYKNTKGNISWHQHGEEESAYSAESLKPGNTLLFGRVTFEEMASYWPSQVAIEQTPVIAKGMNEAEKIVFSRTVTSPSWQNTTVIKDDIVAAVKTLKQNSDKDMTLLGSGSILGQLAEADLIDEYQLMIDPVAIGAGATLFEGVKRDIELALTNSRRFKSGVILAFYEPKRT